MKNEARANWNLNQEQEFVSLDDINIANSSHFYTYA